MCYSLDELKCYTSYSQRVFTSDICIPTYNYTTYFTVMYIPCVIFCLVVCIYKLKEKKIQKHHKEIQCVDVCPVHIVIEPDDSISIGHF